MRTRIPRGFAAALLATALNAAHADAVTDWNRRLGDLVTEAKIGTPPAVRICAIVQTSVLEALATLPANDERAAEAAVASANRTALSALLPAVDASTNRAYEAALAAIPDGAAKRAGIEAGERAGRAVLARRASDRAAAPDTYRPLTTPGTYVPTSAVAVPHWPERQPWLMERADQFRPAPPPALESAVWARDFNEVKTIGSRTSTVRTAEQTQVAKFWEYSLPSIYFGVLRSAVDGGQRSPLQNARAYAALAQGMDDAVIAVMDAKYHYNFWRPQTAIRNADLDRNPDTARDAGWVPFIDAPLHPEYPSAHAILAGVVGTVVQAEIGTGASPVLSATSPTANGTTRRWPDAETFIREVGDARVYDGIHYRFSSETGAAMGRKIGALAVARVLQPQP